MVWNSRETDSKGSTRKKNYYDYDLVVYISHFFVTMTQTVYIINNSSTGFSIIRIIFSIINEL